MLEDTEVVSLDNTRVTTDVRHPVDGRRDAEHASPRVMNDPIVEIELGLGVIFPVETGTTNRSGPASSSKTRFPDSADRRFARVAPAEPTPHDDEVVAWSLGSHGQSPSGASLDSSLMEGGSPYELQTGSEIFRDLSKENYLTVPITFQVPPSTLEMCITVEPTDVSIDLRMSPQ